MGGLLLSGAMWAQEPPAASAAAPGDTILQMLKDRGLVSVKALEDSQGVVQQVRHVASELVISAMNFLGVPYRRGGDHADEGFDCSGFTRHIFENSVGLLLPRRVDDQADYKGLLTIQREELKPGDLVFFNTLRRTFSHVGIYIGEGKFIHSPRAGGQVRIEDMRKAYWHQRYTGARRAPQVNPAPQRPGEAADVATLSPALTQPAAMQASLGPAVPAATAKQAAPAQQAAVARAHKPAKPAAAAKPQPQARPADAPRPSEP
jgi:hypothetical protein